MRARAFLLTPFLAPFLFLVLLAGCVEPDTHAPPIDAVPEPSPSQTPYRGQEARDIKALSAEEIEGYRTGGGLGYAKPAELNSYPGPLHALDMGDRLALTPEQREALTALRQEMLAKAVPLGERYLANEAEIEARFRDGSMTPESLAALLAESARIESEIRFAHLDAHIATKALLTRHQVALYDEARGYGDADHAAHEHGA